MNSKAIFGSATIAVGTISAAIGSTPTNLIKKNIRDDLALWGNVLQAEGNALDADANLRFLSKIGKEISATGNSTIVTGLLLKFSTETTDRLFIAGNLLQALGLAVVIGDIIVLPPFPGQSETITGNIIQIIGNSLQANGWAIDLKSNLEKDDKSKNKKTGFTYEDYLENNNEQSESLIATGSWIQAIGSVVSLIGTIKEQTQESVK
ncbi:DUF6944 family repetitive protein [Gottfriedia luciferensis]|uniref:DUF6944 family repetitive protein n=1 Tax=Gottfriedia luciferensis TaxID=178774 RepID=UPI001F3CE242|nr:hypothetical protein [Gottfriedia luciferensis]